MDKIAEFYYKFRDIIIIVYILKMNYCTRVQNVHDVRFTSNRGVFASGSLHWTTIRSLTNTKDLIVGFDLELQQFKEVHFP